MTTRKSSLLPLLCLLVFAGCSGKPQSSQAVGGAAPPPDIKVYFSPKGGCTDAVVRALGDAKATVLVQAYSFTSKDIANALVDAHRRGVKVEAILDKSARTDHYTEADFLAHAGIPVKIDAAHSIAHNKVMVIDGEIVVTGSFNFTTAAEEHNAENLLVIRSKELADSYAKNWQAHAGHSEEYTGRGRRSRSE